MKTKTIDGYKIEDTKEGIFVITPRGIRRGPFSSEAEALLVIRQLILQEAEWDKEDEEPSRPNEPSR